MVPHAVVLLDDKEPTVSYGRTWCAEGLQSNDNLVLKAWTISPKYHSIQHY